MLRKWKVIGPLALGAAGALAAAMAILLKKPAEEAAGASAAPKKSVPAGPLSTGIYSFISGNKDAVTVELSLDYNPERFSFEVVAEDFLSYSSDTHVALVSGEDFRFQLEYADYYRGEDFPALGRSLTERYQTAAPVDFGEVTGICYVEGDGLCIALPIPDNDHSYVLVTVFKAPDNDAELLDLPADPELGAMLGSIRFQSHR